MNINLMSSMLELSTGQYTVAKEMRSKPKVNFYEEKLILKVLSLSREFVYIFFPHWALECSIPAF